MDAEPALATLRRMFVPEEIEAADGDCGGEPDPPHGPTEKDTDRAVPAPLAQTIDAARKLADELRACIEAILRPTRQSTPGDATAPPRVALRGTVSGSPNSLSAEAARRRGTCVHALRPQLRE